MDLFKNPIFLLAVYGTACYVLTLLTRKIVETARPDFKKQADANDAKISYVNAGARWWNEAILYTLAPLFGVLLALGMCGTEYFPEVFKANKLVVVMAGLCVGFTCGWFFKIFKKLLSKASGFADGELDKKEDGPEIPGSD